MKVRREFGLVRLGYLAALLGLSTSQVARRLALLRAERPDIAVRIGTGKRYAYNRARTLEALGLSTQDPLESRLSIVEGRLHMVELAALRDGCER
jgi:hypothetical protein